MRTEGALKRPLFPMRWHQKAGRGPAPRAARTDGEEQVNGQRGRLGRREYAPKCMCGPGSCRHTANPLGLELGVHRSEEHTSELQSLQRISYAVFCLKTKNQYTKQSTRHNAQQ